MPAAVQRIKDIEHRGDEMTHQLLIKLNQTFITPFDREDIHLLASSLDDVLDFVYGASDRLVTYKITQPSPSAKMLAGIILKQAEELGKAVACSKRHHVLEHCVEVNRLENEADQVARSHWPAVRWRLRSHHPDQTQRASGDPGRSHRQGGRRRQRSGNRCPEERLRLSRASNKIQPGTRAREHRRSSC